MTIYLLIHYEHGDMRIREVYATLELAKANHVTRTPSGRRSTALDAHDEHCCEIEAWDVESEPVRAYDYGTEGLGGT